MSLLDLITGGKSSESSADLEKALQAIQAVQTPTADEMKYKVQQLVSAGKITPQQAKTFLQDPNALASLNIDQTGTNAQQQSISGLLSAANHGGLNPEEEAQMQQILQQLGTQEKGANDAALQNQAARGALTSGETLAAQLQNNQNATVNANQNATATAGQAYQQMLNELSQAGALGSGLQGQQNTQANTVGAATNAINQFNAAQQQGTENLNTTTNNNAQQANLQNEQGISNQNVGNANQYSQYQAQLPQQIYQDQLQKASAEAGAYGNQANNASQQGAQQASLIGNIIGTGGQVAAAGFGKPVAPTTGAAGYSSGYAPPASANTEQYAPPGYSMGGEIRNYLNGGSVGGRAPVSGNSPKNDIVPARLSPGEIVLPRTIAQNPQEANVMDFLNRVRQKKEGPTQIHPEDSAHLLKALTIARHQP